MTLSRSAHIPVIVFGDYIAAYGVIRALGPLDIPVFVVSDTRRGLCTYSRYVREVLQLDAQDPDFLFHLLKWGSRVVGTEAVLIIAGGDEYLDTLSSDLDKMPPGWRPTFPSWEIVKKIREKRHPYTIADAAGVPVPKSFFVGSEEDLRALLRNDLNARWPLLLKPEFSRPFLQRYRVKAVVCNQKDDLLPLYARFDGFGGKLIVQEMIPGPETNLLNFIGIYNESSEPVCVFVNKKRRSSGTFLSCSLMETMWSDELINYSNLLIKSIKYFGYANAEFKLDPRDNVIRLMEVNGRVSMSNSHALACGINLPLAMYRMAIGDHISVLNEFKHTYDNNILWWSPQSDLGAVMKMIKTRSFSLKDYISSLNGRQLVIEPFNIEDPGPGIWVMSSTIRSGIRRLARNVFG